MSYRFCGGVFRTVFFSIDSSISVQASQPEIHYDTSYREPSVVKIGSIKSMKAMRKRHKVKTCGM